MSNKKKNEQEFVKEITPMETDFSQWYTDVILKTEVPNLDLIPSHIDLVGAEIEMISIPTGKWC